MEAIKMLLSHSAHIKTFLLFNNGGLSCDGNAELIVPIVKDGLTSDLDFLNRLSESCCVCLETFSSSHDLEDIVETSCCKKFIHRF